MKYTALGILLFTVASYSSLGIAADNKLIETCISCHGADGKTGKQGVTALGGRTYEELVSAMKNLREANIPEPQLLHTMSDKDIHDVATYFSKAK
jgi:cytochrome c553